MTRVGSGRRQRHVPVPGDLFDNELLERLERETVSLETDDGTEYLAGVDGGVLFIPRDDH